MAIITVELDPNEPMTEEQIKELEALKDRPITYDEDCPPLTEEQLKQLRENGIKQRAIQKEFLEVYGPFEGYEGGNHEALQYLMHTALRYNIHLPYAIPHEIEFVFASAAKKYFADKGINRPFSLCPRVLHVRPLEDYMLEISFNTGETGYFNVSPYLERDEFQELKDPDFFKKAHQEHGAVVWDKTLVIDPETLYKNSKPDSNRQSKRVPEKERQKCFFPEEYRGYHAVIEYDAENKVYVGTIDGIRDLVTFEAESESELFTQFQEAVDDYIDFCATLREAGLSMFTEDYMQPEDGDTDEETTLFEDLMEGLNEAIAYERGEGDAKLYRVETPALEIQFLEGTAFEVTFQDGYVKRYDIAQLFEKYPQLKALEDRTLFLSGKLDGYYGIRWTDELDLETETVYQEGETVRKLSPNHPSPH